MSAECPFCNGECAGADLAPLLDPRLNWLWEQIGRAADRRGDAALTGGSLTVHAPSSADERAAAAGLLGGRTLRQGQTRGIGLERLTLKLRVRGPQLTPGAVAAHALSRRLAFRAAADKQRQRREQELLDVFVGTVKCATHDLLSEPDRIWSALRRSGWIARVLGATDSERLLRAAVSVVAALPRADARTDRRCLAAAATGDPHALDHGSPLAGLVTAILVGAGRVKTRQRPRDVWASVGVDCDDVVGGLIAVGILPVGWNMPAGATVSLPPRVLDACEWPAPGTPDSWVFVTENPSVASAAADLAANGHTIRLLCTNGTPSTREIAAIGRLADRQWRVAVRADFDAAGLRHVAALLQAVPRSMPWRMGVGDYIESFRGESEAERSLDSIPDSPWDPQLSEAMRRRGVPSYEESSMPYLLEDLRHGALQ